MKYSFLLTVIVLIALINCSEDTTSTFYEEVPFPDEPVYEERNDFVKYRFNDRDFFYEEILNPDGTPKENQITATDRGETFLFNFNRPNNFENPISISFTAPKDRELRYQFESATVATFEPNTGQVYAMAQNNNILYVGGRFGTAGEIEASRIARWDGSSWQVLGGGLNGNVYTIKIAPNGELVVGGNFTRADGMVARRIAKWDGSSWSNIGEGFDAAVQAIGISPGGEIYAGGYFIASGMDTLNYIAKWNPASAKWDSMGTGANRVVRAIDVNSSGEVYVGGEFSRMNGVDTRRIAVWNGNTQTWSAVGPGLDGTVFDIKIRQSTGTVYVGGSFTASGATSTRKIAVWENNSWSTLGEGFNRTVRSMELASNGEIIVGGDFSTSGAIEVNRVAKWNGATWNGLGNGLTARGDSVYAVAIFGNDIFVGGNFIKTDGLITNRVAKWDGSNWSALNSGVAVTYKVNSGEIRVTHLSSVGIAGEYKFGYTNNVGEEFFTSGNFLTRFENE